MAVNSNVQFPTRRARLLLFLAGFAVVFLAKAFLILAPSFLDINELSPWRRASPQPIVKIDPSVVRSVQRREPETVGKPKIIHPFHFVDQFDDALHRNRPRVSFTHTIQS